MLQSKNVEYNEIKCIKWWAQFDMQEWFKKKKKIIISYGCLQTVYQFIVIFNTRSWII